MSGPSSEGHRPVMLSEVVAGLSPKDGARYIDGTFGGGGYARAILEAADCRLLGIDRDPDAIARGHRLPPPKGGSVFRVIEYPPDSERLAAIAHEEKLPDDGSGRAAATDRNNPRHPGFHKTATIDYAIVLSGEIFAMMDDGEVLLQVGDVLIQRGTNHAWSNRTNETAVVAFVLIDAERV